MNKELFDKFLNKEIVINCETEEEEREFLTYCHNKGLVWCSNDSLLECRQWGIYREDTCYSVYTGNELCYGKREYYTKEYKKTIVLYKDLIKQDKQEFSKKDLKTGHIVRFRDGETAILIGNEFKNSHQVDKNFCCTCLEYYNEELKDEADNENDIMEVYYIKSTDKTYDLKQLVFEIPKEHTELVWERGREIDWTKVPKWTKVLVRNKGNKKWRRAYFIREAKSRFVASFFDEFILEEFEIFIFEKKEWIGYWDEIKPFDEKDIKGEWYK